MTEAQGYVKWLSQLLAEYGSDPDKCEAIMRQDTETGGLLLPLLLEWYAADHPDQVTVTQVKKSALETIVTHADGVVHQTLGGQSDTPPSTLE